MPATIARPALNLRRQLKINWLVLSCISLPIIATNWFWPGDVKGATYSDFTFLLWLFKRGDYHLTKDVREFFSECMVWNVGPPLLAGWILQYLVVLAWEAWRNRGK